ncbi:hypothetical protein LEP1GSC104_1106 [Leptospira interrogans str. UI 12621]|uniref:Uncharacterized protein n=1 Tax=Leptospira interrogans str. UI 12621 TaxID=1049937 RepID=A0A0F6HEW1_LEPIR|nr:hypothetical protein LEP1GSC104_1106 [Leptospira interrogans str. UI 12621]
MNSTERLSMDRRSGLQKAHFSSVPTRMSLFTCKKYVFLIEKNFPPHPKIGKTQHNALYESRWKLSTTLSMNRVEKLSTTLSMNRVGKLSTTLSYGSRWKLSTTLSYGSRWKLSTTLSYGSRWKLSTTLSYGSRWKLSTTLSYGSRCGVGTKFYRRFCRNSDDRS